MTIAKRIFDNLKILGLGAAMLGSACAAPAGPTGAGDGRDDSFGGALAKADGRYTECQVLEVLKLVNESTTDVAALQALGIRSNAAANIVAHRLGADGQPGTADDDVYDDLAELDAIEFVGPATLDAAVQGVRDRCEVTLDQPFIDADTFAGSTGGGWTRDNDELEATMTVTGVTGQELNAILSATDDRDRTGFERLRRIKEMEGFAYSYGVDEMPWDRTRHRAREQVRYLPLTIESGRYEPDEDGERELSLGTDIMDDVYYDTNEFSLVRNDIVLRGRARWDGPDTIRRLLIAAKFGAEIGEDGIKRSAKIDVRTDSPDAYIASLDYDVRRGIVGWTGRETPVEPVRAVYERLVELGATRDVGNHADVLFLEPTAHIRSVRSRYHLDIPYRNHVMNVHVNGAVRIQRTVDRASAALSAGTVPAGDVADVEALVAFGEGLLDGSLVAERAGVDPATMTLPKDFAESQTDRAALDANRAVAEAVDALYHEFADAADDVDRAVTGTDDLDGDDYVDWFVAWNESVNPSLRIKTVMDPHLSRYLEIAAMADADRQAQIDAFNQFGAERLAAEDEDFEDFEAIDEALWTNLRAHLEYEVQKIGRRQIEAAGTVANMLWFDQARSFYIPGSSRPWGNFLIDTVDFTQMLTHEEWESIPEADRRIDRALDPAKVFHTVLVNEVQIELGQETAFIDRIQALTELIASGSGTADDEAMLAGARWVFDQYMVTLQTVAEMKGDSILDDLDDAGASDAAWVPAQHSKGITALRILADLD